MGVVLAALVILALLLLLNFCSKPEKVDALHPLAGQPTLMLGDAVVTGFSGIVKPDEGDVLPDGKGAIDQTFIDSNGPAVRIFDPRNPGFVWNGSYWSPPRRHDIPARSVGQVFGIAIDNRAFPNIYLTATSAYGLNIVTPDEDRDFKPERVVRGSAKAVWAPGQMGPGGSSGSVWKVDGKTGQITRFADIELDGRPTGPAGLGTIAFDAGHQQLFVSDLSTGMIHRLSLKGEDLGHFDHGVEGRPAIGLGKVAYDHRKRADITDATFESQTPETWGFTVPERRVWGLAVHEGRLYYAVMLGQASAQDGHGAGEGNTGQIWSVGLSRRGAFLHDARLEVTLPEGTGDAPVSDIVFASDGAMIVAQRSIVGTDYTYAPLPKTGIAHVYRFWPETPNDPETKSDWYQAPERYSVGFEPGNQTSAGGVALGYGYDSDGKMLFDDCEGAIFLTGDRLRSFRPVEDRFEPGGPLLLNGLQINPAGPVRGFNAPPIISYFVNYADAMTDSDTSGRVGDVAVYHLDCASPSCVAGDAMGMVTQERRKPVVVPPPDGPPPADHPTGDPGCVGLDCVPPDVICVGDDCPPEEPQQCMKVEGQAVCDPEAGGWVYKLFTQDYAGIGLDTLSLRSRTLGVNVSNGPNITVVPPPGIVSLSGTTPGQSVTIDVCGYNAAAKATGEPYDCCRDTVTITVPNGVCEPADDDGGPL